MPKSLSETNPYLLDLKIREAALRRSAASSSAVEGIRRPFQRPADKRDAVKHLDRSTRAASSE
jgi:hypothetical protein